MADANDFVKVLTDAIFQAAEEHPEVVKELVIALDLSAGVASKMLPRVARRMRESGRLELALILSAVHGAVDTFGFGGLVVTLFKLRFGGKKNASRPGKEKA